MSWQKAIILNPNEQVHARVKRKIYTLLHNPKGVKRKYGMILRFKLKEVNEVLAMIESDQK